MAATHLYVVLQGGYNAPGLAAERWQTGARFGASPGGGDPAEVGTFDPFDVVALNQNVTEPTYTIQSNWTTEMGLNDLDPVSWLNDQVRPAAAAFIATSNLFAAAVRLDSILVYPIRSPDGKVEPAVPFLQGSPCRLDYVSSNPVGTATGGLPPQLTIVASLRTQQVGRRGRGRMFTPIVGTAGNTTGRVASGVQTSMGNAVRDFLQGCRLDGSGPGGVSVYPVVTGAPFTAYAIINQVRVGDVFDTQQRRRRALDEAYVNTAVDPFL